MARGGPIQLNVRPANFSGIAGLQASSNRLRESGQDRIQAALSGYSDSLQRGKANREQATTDSAIANLYGMTNREQLLEGREGILNAAGLSPAGAATVAQQFSKQLNDFATEEPEAFIPKLVEVGVEGNRKQKGYFDQDNNFVAQGAAYDNHSKGTSVTVNNAGNVAAPEDPYKPAIAKQIENANALITDFPQKVEQYEVGHTKAQNILTDLNALNDDTNWLTTGKVQQITPDILKSPSYLDYENKIEALINSLTLDKFQKLRKDGVTFGAMSDGEWAIIKTSIANLNQDQSPMQQRQSLKRLYSSVNSAMERSTKKIKGQYKRVNATYKAHPELQEHSIYAPEKDYGGRYGDAPKQEAVAPEAQQQQQQQQEAPATAQVRRADPNEAVPVVAEDNPFNGQSDADLAARKEALMGGK